MSNPKKTLALWALLIVMFLVIWQFLAPESGSRESASIEPIGTAWLPTLLIAAFVFATVFGLRGLAVAGAAAQSALNLSNALLEAGRFAEAEQSLAGVLRSRLPHRRRAAELQRAEIAARRCDLEEARRRVEPAMREPIGFFFRAAQRTVVANARALSAFLSAAAGDVARARADIDAISSSPEAEPSAMARAVVAEALLFDRSGDRAGLRELLDRRRLLLMQSSLRRERALVRAFDAMLESGSTSVYRQKADRSAQSPEQSAIDDWMARYAPNAAPFVRAFAVGPVNAVDDFDARAEPSGDARSKVDAARPLKNVNGNAQKAMILWVALIMIFLGVWTYFNDGRGPDPIWVISLVLVVLGGLVVWFVLNLRRYFAHARKLSAAVRAYGCGDLDSASRELAFEPKAAVHRVQASHWRAEIAIAKGDMSAALTACDAGLAALSEAQGGRVLPPSSPAKGGLVSWDFPRALAAQRAFALSALGRGDEALAELAWANGFPDELPRLRVRLVNRLRSGDWESAAQFAEKWDPGIVISARDEILVDVVRFVARRGARSDSEATRLRAEMRRIPNLSRSIEAVAPGLLAEFEQTAAKESGADLAGSIDGLSASTS